MRTTAFVTILTAFLALGCQSNGPRLITDVDGGGGNGDGSVSPGTDGQVPPRPDAAPFDPFDPANACGSSTIPTTRVPGSLMIVFDRSGSMRDTPDGGDASSTDPSKWDLATGVIDSVLSSVSDELSAGLMLFPSNSDCGVPSTPDVPIAPLSTTRSQIQSALSGTGPGGNTPAFDALTAAYQQLDVLTTPGQRGVVLVTDGGESCNLDSRDTVLMRVQTEHDTKNRLTFAVGLGYADNNLSTIAYNGGTPRNDTCMPMCTSNSCLDDSECGAGSCVKIASSICPVPD